MGGKKVLVQTSPVLACAYSGGRGCLCLVVAKKMPILTHVNIGNGRWNSMLQANNKADDNRTGLRST